ncbi:uncharacterized protein LOC129752900 [Uranotaenia lowii]|uniref:uncharacterized protein LOC129752900 n=1 Tax=Uranotaenia lowii TaxID=190385 RepID=UPI00247875DE|nr:uncharacterized protein LOC129752900 [Uranotaenia lowii]
MSNDRRLKNLRTRHRSLLASFSNIRAFVETYDEEQHECQVAGRLEHLVSLWNDFNGVQAELETLDEAEIDNHLKQRIEFESSFFEVKGFLLSKNKHSPSTPASSSSHSAPHSPAWSSHVRLPDVKLPVFSGSIDSWLNFHDLFVSLVHSSHELSNIQKFYYLRSSLSGEALKLIQTINISANNYIVAWTLLVEHYQKPARLKQSYVDSLFEFSTLKRESSTELRFLVERFEANVKVLKQLGEKTQFWDILLIRMLSIRLDPTTRRDWEEQSSTLSTVTFHDLTEFIQRRASVLEALSKNVEPVSNNVIKKSPTRLIASHGANQSNFRKCVVCSDHHPLYLCSTFSKLSLEEKEREVRQHQLCRNCLRKGHQVKDCSSTSACRYCRNRHHSQLCSTGISKTFDTTKQRQPTTFSNPQPSVSLPAASIEAPCFTTSKNNRKTILLATALLSLVDDNGTEHVARALLDSGSESCFITQSFSQLIKVHRQKLNCPIVGIGQSTTQARFKIRSSIRSRVCQYSTTLDFLVLPKVTIDLPSTEINASSLKIPPGIELADPSFHKTSRIDMILGAEIFFELFETSGRINLGDGQPTLINSVFGWVVSGECEQLPPTRPIVANLATISDLNNLMERFWSIEDDSSSPSYSVEEAACETHFQQNVRRTPEGRYCVRLPVKNNVLDNLSDNRRTALRRFHMLENKLNRDEGLKQQYDSFMEEYESLGHMQKVFDYEQPPTPCYHLPHHAVIREDSTTTKVRVVFDASCKTPSGPSLNNALMVGPIVQEDLRSIIMRSRIRPIMLLADIKQMYRQILVDEGDTPLQRIVWRTSPEAPMQTYELKTVTYGTASAPYLATRVLQQLAEDENERFPRAAKVLRRDFYVDDLFSGADSIQDAINLQKQLDQLLRKGCFELRKWASNVAAVLKDIPPENRAVQSSVDLDRDQCLKTLGLHWEPAPDHLRYRINLPESPPEQPLTKRIALSHIARLFDPLGLLGPVVTSAKLFMQALWGLKNDDGRCWDWDQELPSAATSFWKSYHSQLILLNELRIERCILHSNPTSVQLHIFSDASERAYGACAYVRSTDSSDLVKVALLTARSKVAPLHRQSIPRLELCGALIAAELYKKVMLSLQLQPETFFWVDSTTVLHWLKSAPSSWVTFVANRVSKIQLATENCSWNHVPGYENPADLLSRGTTAETLLQSDLWWHGPDWLKCGADKWPTQQHISQYNSEVLQEARKTPISVITATSTESFINELTERFSSFRRMVNTIAYCRRLKLKKTDRPSSTILSCEEIEASENALISLVQQQEFSSEWSQLQQGKPVPTKSRLRWFHPFLSESRVIRIGGRLSHATLPYNTRHQILLPGTHRFSKLLVQHHHAKHLHAAPQLLISLLRTQYWIIGARDLAKRVVHACVICFRARPKQLEQFMGDLPANRVNMARPFAITGIDYWGPIQIQPSHRRAAPRKVYVAVFVCFCTKAVHIELVSDLTAAKFIQALQRFVSRRGLCSEIYSDNGRNFVGAANELRQIVRSKEHQKALAEECTNNGIRWHFNPPKASHFGGLWEAAIASAQKHFLRVIGNHTLPYDEMETLLAQIESCLNSRPISSLSDDPSDFDPLTPGHFLVGGALKAVPQLDLSSIPYNRLNNWHRTQKLLQDIWKRWQLEYVSTLQQRSKWYKPPVIIQKGCLALLKDENSPPMSWKLARITDLHPGPDGITRVVTLRTSNSIFTRPVAKICLLPIEIPSAGTTSPPSNNATPDSPMKCSN